MTSALLTEFEISKIPHRGRGLSSFQSTGSYIDDFIAKSAGKTLRILEIGCGFGQLLLDLKIKYGDRVDLYGINIEEDSVSIDLMSRVAKYTNKISDDYVVDSGVTFKFADAGQQIPFDDNYFDLIVSQVAIIYIHDKANFLKEINRVLSTNGLATMWTGFELTGDTDEIWTTFEIYDDSRLLNIREYLQQFPNIIYKMSDMGTVIKMTKGAPLKMDIRLRNVVELHLENDRLHGVRSVYETV